MECLHIPAPGERRVRVLHTLELEARSGKRSLDCRLGGRKERRSAEIDFVVEFVSTRRDALVAARVNRERFACCRRVRQRYNQRDRATSEILLYRHGATVVCSRRER